jgi:hypothetical protein
VVVLAAVTAVTGVIDSMPSGEPLAVGSQVRWNRVGAVPSAAPMAS